MNFNDQRDSEIMEYLKQGFAFKEVASRLEVKVRTIEIRLARMRERNQARTNMELMARYVEEQKSTLVFRFMQDMIGKTQHNGSG